MDEGWTWGDSRGLCIGLGVGPRDLGGGGGPIPGMIGFESGLFAPAGWAEGRRYGGRI